MTDDGTDQPASGTTPQDGLRLRSGSTNLGRMERGTARLWREADRWVIEIEIDGVPYTERDYADIASASQAIAQILRQHAERSTDMDQDVCEACDEPLDLMTCSQCGADAFVRTCDHDGNARPIRTVDGAGFCRACRA
jgi:hypothetical protein